jgi:deazaflavin-dependent oxidoreductase (nitroreductase family)
VAQLRSAHGQIQHGPFSGVPLLIFTTSGARSGRPCETPLAYTRDDDGRYVVVASNGGPPTHPAWLHNLRAHPNVTVEVDGERFQARATMADGAERDRLYARPARALDSPGAPRGLPSFSDYQRQTSRPIPVVLLERTGR